MENKIEINFLEIRNHHEFQFSKPVISIARLRSGICGPGVSTLRSCCLVPHAPQHASLISQGAGLSYAPSTRLFSLGLPPSHLSVPAYPSHFQVPAYPSHGSVPAYPRATFQSLPTPATFPSQPGPATFHLRPNPAHFSVPAYPSHFSVPTYPSHFSVPAYLNHFSVLAYTSHFSVPAYPSHFSVPAYLSHFSFPAAFAIVCKFAWDWIDEPVPEPWISDMAHEASD